MSQIGVNVSGPSTTFPSLSGASGQVSNTTQGAAQAILIELRVLNRLLYELARGTSSIDELTNLRLDEAANIALAGTVFAS